MVTNDTKYWPQHNRTTESLPFSLLKRQVYFTDQIKIVRLLNKATLRYLQLTSSSNCSVKMESMSSKNVHEKLVAPWTAEVYNIDELNTCAREI